LQWGRLKTKVKLSNNTFTLKNAESVVTREVERITAHDWCGVEKKSIIWENLYLREGTQ